MSTNTLRNARKMAAAAWRQPGKKYCSTQCEDAKKFMTLTVRLRPSGVRRLAP